MTASINMLVQGGGSYELFKCMKKTVALLKTLENVHCVSMHPLFVQVTILQNKYDHARVHNIVGQ